MKQEPGRIILDTGAFFRHEALRQLAQLAQPVIVPAVVYMERVRQLHRDTRDIEAFHEILEQMRFRIEPFGKQEATRYAPTIHDDAAWRRLARDAMIAGHIGKDDILWTTNPKDFLAIGVPPEQIMDLR